MLKLGAALNGFEPGEGAARIAADPVGLLAAAWSDIVGADVARNSRPSQISDGTLLVTTRSSAWSQQLSFLTEPVVAAVNARLPSAGIGRLRFRVGRVAEAAHAAREPAAGRRIPPSAPEPPAPTLEGAVAQLRRRVDGARRAKRQAGWKECVGCAAFLGPGSGRMCRSCEAARAADRERIVSRLLFEAPWLGFEGTAALVDGLRYHDYQQIRKTLLSRWWLALQRVKLNKSMSRDESERLIASSYVLLQSGLAPEQISPAIVRNVLGDELHDRIYGSERLEN